MALLIKNTNVPRAAGVTGTGYAAVRQWIHIARAAAVLPASTTEWFFQVQGGRVALGLLLGESTVVLTSTDPGLSFNSTKLNAAGTATVGTTTVLATTVNLASLEVGGLAVSQNAGTALVKANAGGYVNLAISDSFAVVPNGEIYATTTGTNTTGQMKWDLWYMPLDEGAFVTAKNSGTAII